MPEQQQLPPLETRVVVNTDGVRIHTCTAPEAFLANSTHIIETENSLVLVDGQFVVPYANQFRRYADSLGKPIERVFLSHAHVDHFFGLGAAFGDVPIAAAAATTALLREHGEEMRAEEAQQYGPLVPDRIAIPQLTVTPGIDVIDAVKYEIDVVAAAECDAQLLIRLPDFGVTVVQDLVYSGAHLYVTRQAGHWISVLQGLADSGSEMFLAGHGPPANRAEVHRNIEYLEFAERTLVANSDPQAYQAAMLAAYPQRTGAAVLDIYVPRLYGRADG